MCPECGSEQVVINEYDFGICPQTGYHDAGERYQCFECGATGDISDVVVTRSGEFPGTTDVAGR